jgi:cation:H+ antiporter
MKLAGFLGGAAKGSAVSASWTFPAIVGGSFLIAWAAESAQFFMSQGLSLAILAWVQTLPEFAVEAVIAWQAPRTPNGMHLVSANFTGAVRLLVGLGWPMIYGVAAVFHRRKHGRPLRAIHLEEEHSVEVVGLFLPILYFCFIVLKGTLGIWDGIVLIVLYIAYMFILNRIPPKELENPEDEEWPVRKIVTMKPAARNSTIAALFIGGAVIIYFTAEPFLHSLLALALSLGVSQFVFVQWVAPFLSEFPEKLSAFYWARKVTGAPMALMNMVSSNINQWTMLAAMIPFVVALSAGHIQPIAFDHEQRVEFALTIAQSALGMCLLANLSFAWYEALVLFTLWLTQFFVPSLREETAILYGVWLAYEILAWLMGYRKPVAITAFARLFKERVLRKGTTGLGD